MASTRATLSQNNYWQYRSSNRAALGPVSEWRAGLRLDCDYTAVFLFRQKRQALLLIVIRSDMSAVRRLKTQECPSSESTSKLSATACASRQTTRRSHTRTSALHGRSLRFARCRPVSKNSGCGPKRRVPLYCIQTGYENEGTGTVAIHYTAHTAPYY